MADMLLERPSDISMRNYYDGLTASGRGAGLRVDQIGGVFGKGLFADKNFEEGELVLQEPNLVGAQHTANKGDALVCSFCFRYIGSIELQIGRRLLAKVDGPQPNHLSHHSSNEGHDNAMLLPSGSSHDSSCNDPEERSGSHFGQTGNEKFDMDLSKEDEDCNDACNSIMGAHNEENGCGESSMWKSISAELVSGLLEGKLRLPYSENFPLPPITECPGGCTEEAFCSEACADEAWKSSHSLLCLGPKSLCQDQKALLNFKEHADVTNDIFHIAAQVIAGTVLRARNLKAKRCNATSSKQVDNWQDKYATLLEAWGPFAMGHKKLWWEAVALPEDVDPSQEENFRDQMKELAQKSLEYLKEAIYEDEFAPLFDLKVYGHIIGMFEQNNLEIVVPSPVEDYFIYVDDLPSGLKAEADKITRPFLDALGSDYATHCSGSGFFVLQSCINHSCRPNAKAFKRDEDRDGQAVLLATGPVKKGEEITISYIHEDGDLEERQAMLADYGFVCSCDACVEESSMKIFSSKKLADVGYR